MKNRTIAAGIVAALLLVTGCSSSGSEKTDGPKEILPSNTEPKGEEAAVEPAEKEAEEAETTTTEAPETTTTTAPEPDGSKESPLAVGKGAVIGDWEVVVTELVPDATAEVQGGNQFNDPPTKGVFMKIVFEATYKGTDEGMPDSSLGVTLSGSDSVQYDHFDCAAAFGSMDFPTLEPGGKATSSRCIDAPAAAIAGGTVFVEDTFSFEDEDRTYWAIP